MTPAELYSRIYAAETERGIGYGDGEISKARTDIFLQAVKDHVPPGSSTLEIGTGRGRLLRLMLDAGYAATGIEIATSLFEKDLVGLNVINLPAQELRIFADASFDCTLSNDCLEHLPTEDAVVQAVDDMVRISKKWIVISVGAFASSFKVTDKTLNVELHSVLHDWQWWDKFFGERMTIVRKFMLAGSFLAVGRKGSEENSKEPMRWQF